MRNVLYIITNTRTGETWNGSILGSGDWGMRVSRPGKAHFWGYQIDIWDEDIFTLEKAYGPLPRRG